MSNNKTFAREPNWDELQELARLYLILRTLREASKKKPDERTPEEKKLDELEEYNPYFSREMWKGEVTTGNTLTEEDRLLIEKFGLGLKE